MSPMRARRLDPCVVASSVVLLAVVADGPIVGVDCPFQSRSRVPLDSCFELRELSPVAMARGADGVEGGNDLEDAGPSGIRFSLSYR